MLAGLPVGHGPRNLAFPFGVPAVLDADAGTLVLLEARFGLGPAAGRAVQTIGRTVGIHEVSRSVTPEI